MKYKTLNEYQVEKHPWPAFIPPNATKIILGTFPTAQRNRDAYEFFYPNPNNSFWRLIFQAADVNISDLGHEDPIESRKQILSHLNTGIADMGKRILRQKNSSRDDNLFPVEYTDLFSILDEHLTVHKLIVTSSSGSNSVLSWFTHYCLLNNVKLVVPKSKLPIKTSFFHNDREVDVEIISSPSGLSPIKGDPLFRMYREAILGV